MKMSILFVPSWRTLVVFFAAFLLAHVVSAREIEIGSALKIGTTGFGADVTFGLVETMNLRAGLNMLSLSFDFEDDDDDADDDELTLNVKLQTLPLLLDWHPRRRNFRLSGGIVLNNNKLSFEADAGERDFNDVDYLVDSFDIDVTFNTISPYLGIGYGNAIRPGGRWRFAFDFGVMLHGTPKVRGRAVATNPEQQERLNQDVDEELEEFRDEMKGFTFYPVLTLGLSYRF